jgi:hypothetical protein
VARSLDGSEVLLEAIHGALMKRTRERVQENLSGSMRLWKEFKELEKKTIDVMRRIRGRK